jgi:hypothetical protein
MKRVVPSFISRPFIMAITVVVAFATAACAGSSSTSAEAVSAAPLAPAPPIASERVPATGVPAPQAPAAVTGPPASTPPLPMAEPPATPPAPAGAGDAPGYGGPDPCRLAIKGDSPVAKACREGGIKSAKVVMKDLIKNARAAGVKYQCDDCHANDSDYTQLSKGAQDKFAKLLAVNRK